MAQIKVPYEFGGRQFEGIIVYDDSVSGRRPAIVMQPDWFGVCDRTAEMAAQIAGKEYVVLLTDTYGVGYGERDKTPDQLLESAVGARKDLDLVIQGGQVALDAMMAAADEKGLIDRDKTGAIGFCMGGGIALEQARAGADYKGTVVFHVTLPNPVDESATPAFKGRVLAIHGAIDPVTPKAMMDALEEELAGAGVDWQVTTYGGGMHAFCVEGANNPPQSLYDPALAARSFKMMRDFFAETF